MAQDGVPWLRLGQSNPLVHDQDLAGYTGCAWDLREEIGGSGEVLLGQVREEAENLGCRDSKRVSKLGERREREERERRWMSENE